MMSNLKLNYAVIAFAALFASCQSNTKKETEGADSTSK